MDSANQPTFSVSEGTTRLETPFGVPPSIPLALKAARATSLVRATLANNRLKVAKTVFSYISERVDLFSQRSEGNVCSFHLAECKDIPEWTKLTVFEKAKVMTILLEWFAKEEFKPHWCSKTELLELTWEVPTFSFGTFQSTHIFAANDVTKKRKIGNKSHLPV